MRYNDLHIPGDVLQIFKKRFMTLLKFRGESKNQVKSA